MEESQLKGVGPRGHRGPIEVRRVLQSGQSRVVRDILLGGLPLLTDRLLLPQSPQPGTPESGQKIRVELLELELLQLLRVVDTLRQEVLKAVQVSHQIIECQFGALALVQLEDVRHVGFRLRHLLQDCETGL